MRRRLLPHTPALRGLVLATHAGPTFAVTTFAIVLGCASGLSASRSALLGAAVLAGQCSTGWHNDWLDADDDRAAERAAKPVVAGLVAVTHVRLAAFAALGVCVPLSLSLGAWSGTLHLLAVASAWAHNGLLKRTLFSPLPWALSFGLLPAVVAKALAGAPNPSLSVACAGALLGVGAHCANGARDVVSDRELGIAGLPGRLGVRSSSLISATCQLAGIVLVRPGVVLLVAASLAVLAVVGVAISGRTRGLFELSVLGALPLVIAVALHGGVLR